MPFPDFPFSSLASAEWLVLLDCARTAANGNNDSPPERLPDPDWDALLELARLHGMTAMLRKHLDAGRGCPAPPDVRNALRLESNQIARRNLLLTGELLRVLSRLEDKLIEAIPFKGPILALQSYGDVTLRPFSDLDILVRHRDVSRARETLTAAGYRTEFAEHSREDHFIHSAERVMRFVKRETGSVIELHWQFDPRNLAFPCLASDDLWLRLKTAPIAGRSFRVLSPEDVVLSLCFHGLKHCWDKLEWICCVTRFVRNNPALDWRWIRSHAKALGGGRALSLGLTLMRDLAGPDFAVPDAGADPVAAQLAARVWKSLLHGSREKARTVSYRYPFYFSARDKVADGLRMLLYSGMQLLRPRRLWRRNRTIWVQEMLSSTPQSTRPDAPA